MPKRVFLNELAKNKRSSDGWPRKVPLARSYITGADSSAGIAEFDHETPYLDIFAHILNSFRGTNRRVRSKSPSNDGMRLVNRP